MIEIILAFLVSMATIVGLGMTVGWRSLHFRLLKRDLKKWQHEGWVSAENAAAILQDARPRGLAGRLVFLVGLLGACLLLFSAISFVAANWEDMSRLARLTWLIALLWSAYLVGWRLTANAHPRLAEIAYLLGVGLFGVNITLIAQMFHIDNHPPDGVLMWTIGALVSAALLQSRAALVLTFIGAMVWSAMEVFLYDTLIHWPFLLIWIPAFLLSIWLRWSFTVHLAFISAFLWCSTSLLRYAEEGHWAPHGVVGLFIMVFMLMLAISFIWQANQAEQAPYDFPDWLERYAVMGLLPALFTLQTIPLNLSSNLYNNKSSYVDGPFYLLQGHWGWLLLTLVLTASVLTLLVLIWREKRLSQFDFTVFATLVIGVLAFAVISTPGLFGTNGWLIGRETHKFFATWVYGAALLALFIWLISFGHRRGSDLYVWASLIGFAVEVLYIYFRIFGSLLETSLFFLIGGVLTMGLAFFLYKLHQRLEEPNSSTSPQKTSEATS